MRKSPALLAALGLMAAAAVRAEPVLTPIAQVRVRQEAFDTLKGTLDKTYTYGAVRARGGLGLRQGIFEARVVGQAVAAYDVPNDASFGSGRSLFLLSDRDASPRAVDLLELTVGLRSDRLIAAAGRQGFKDLPETPTGNERLDWLRRARLSERLVGTWEWTPLGRRFDGVSASLSGRPWDMNAYLGRVLQGGFDVDDGFQPLDDLLVAGVSAGIAESPRLENTDVRLFSVLYRDDRRAARAAAGGDIDVDTVGLSLASVIPLRRGLVDVVAWAAAQRGDYGRFRQRAAAYALEGGYGLPDAPWSPWLRAGVNQASGDDDGSDGRHETFFNVLPTNHKFYGIQDLNAFQNLIDTFVQLRVKPAARWTAEATAHVFRLAERQDAWYGGSGAASDEALGFDARFPAGGAAGRRIGVEFDLVTSWQAAQRFVLEGGISRFEGGPVARRVFTRRHDATYAYLQASFQL